MPIKKLRLASILVVAAAIGIAVYLLLLRGGDDGSGDDPLAYDRRECGTGDALAGGKLDHCVELALDLMGRADGVDVDDDVARALLKRGCDQAHERSCHFLSEYDSTKVEFAQWRCEGRGQARGGRPPAPDAAACLAVGRAYEDGVGREQRWQDARTWYGKACDLGNPQGCQRRDSVVPR